MLKNKTKQKNQFSRFFSTKHETNIVSHWAILGMEITNNGILMTSDYQGRSSGEAYVQFSSKNDAERALEKNKQSIGHRLVWLGMGRLAGGITSKLIEIGNSKGGKSKWKLIQIENSEKRRREERKREEE